MKRSLHLFLSFIFIWVLIPESAFSQSIDFAYTPARPCESEPINLSADLTNWGLPNYRIRWLINGNSYSGSTNTSVNLNRGRHFITLEVSDSITNTFLDTTKVIYVDTFCANNVIEGRLFFDLDSNGIQDSSEYGIPNNFVEIKNGFNSFFVRTDSFGHYSIKVDTGTYIVEPILRPFLNVSTANSLTITFIGANNNSTGNDFGISSDTLVNDLFLSISANVFRPGFASNVYAQVINFGLIPRSASLEISLDTVMNLLNSNPLEDSIINNTVYFNLPLLFPNERRVFRLRTKIDSTIALGTQVKISAKVNPIIDDYNPLDNVDEWTDVVVGSFDPNDKLVFPFDDSINRVDPGEYLKYTIRFQNVGTYFAENVRIEDQISQDLDISTFQMLSASHDYTYEMRPNRNIVWRFDGIQLPAEQDNEPESHGYVKFRIKPNQSLPIGSTVSNRAFIFFDFNLPIITNTIVSTIDTLSTINDIAEFENESSVVKFYPNPLEDKLSILSKNESSTIRIIDLNGRELINERIEGQSKVLNLGQIQSGIYIIKFESEGRVITEKLIKR